MAGFALHQQRIDRERIVSALAVGAVHALLGWALLSGLGVSVQQVVEAPLAAFDVTPPPPPQPEPPPPARRERPPQEEGKASPPNIKSVATEVVAPPVIPIPAPVVTAPIAREGLDPTAGAAPYAGPGFGAGGIGNGTGSGGRGNGPGGGGDGGMPVRLIKGIRDERDCDDGPASPCPSGNVGIEFTVNVKGRATFCKVTSSSGDPALDADTCRMIEKSLRYIPARDRTGRKRPEIVAGTQQWLAIERRPADYDPDRG